MNARNLPRPTARLLMATLGLFVLAGCDSAFWSPDGKSLALDVHGKLRLFNVETKKFTSFNSGGRYVINPTFSPDGKTLAYYAARGKKLAATPQPFSHNEFIPLYPVLSPDNKTIAWPVPHPKTERFELRLYDVATAKQSVYPIP